MQRPKSMTIKLSGSSPDKGPIVYVSDNCTSQFRLEQTRLPSKIESPDPFNPEIIRRPLRKRRALKELQPKCYGWDDVFFLDFQTER